MKNLSTGLVEKVFHIAGGGGNKYVSDMQKMNPPVDKFAVYDVTGKCWLGTSEGVKTWDSFEVARMAATVITEQMGAGFGKYRAQPYHGDATKYKDEVATKMTPLEAIQKLEGQCDCPK